jgi:hypothetical protein
LCLPASNVIVVQTHTRALPFYPYAYYVIVNLELRLQSHPSSPIYSDDLCASSRSTGLSLSFLSSHVHLFHKYDYGCLTIFDPTLNAGIVAAACMNSTCSTKCESKSISIMVTSSQTLGPKVYANIVSMDWKHKFDDSVGFAYARPSLETNPRQPISPISTHAGVQQGPAHVAHTTETFMASAPARMVLMARTPGEGSIAAAALSGGGKAIRAVSASPASERIQYARF